MLVVSGIRERAGRVLVNQNTGRVVAYCPSYDDAQAIASYIEMLEEQNRQMRKRLSQYEDAADKPKPAGERICELKKANANKVEVLTDLFNWVGSVPEPLPPGLADRVAYAIGRTPAKPKKKEVSPC